MLKLQETGLEEFAFGDAPEDTFFILINKNVSPDGLDVERLRLSDPRNFDTVLNDMGCLIMLSGTEVDELVRRGEADPDNLHETLFELAKAEGVL